MARKTKAVTKDMKESETPDCLLFSPSRNITKANFLDKMSKRIKKRSNIELQKVLQLQINRIKSLSPNRRLYSKYSKVTPIIKESLSRYISPMTRNLQIRKLSKVKKANVVSKLGKKFTPARKINMKIMTKLIKAKTKARRKNPSNSSLSRIFGEPVLSPMRHGASENKRYENIQNLKHGSNFSQNVLTSENIHKRKTRMSNQTSIGKHFEVYRSLSPEEGSFNILEKYIQSDSLKNELDPCLSELTMNDTSVLIDTFSQKKVYNNHQIKIKFP
ncbi:unnamed protein product [Moneuplotes crassus]|uniref:Uncharacterized protein n=1 Tax=Euplotes crassus TaxID=5936 RepID=A0AAD1Y1X2_EUPCR|nr:unnamed protein product [Moneuplotes crassus]